MEAWIRDLREHKKKMKEKFRDIYEAEQKQHEARLDTLELITTQLKSCVERGQGVIERNMSAEILQANSAILSRCDELLNAKTPDDYKSPNFNCLVDEKLDFFDKIRVTKTDPSMCLAECQDSQIGKESNFVVVTRDSQGLQCYQQDDLVNVDILTPEGDHLTTEVKNSKDGKYTVTYTPQCVGQLYVSIQVNGQPLTDSPCFVQIHEHQYQFAFKFGCEGKGQEEFVHIRDIAVSDKTGTIAVADTLNHRVQLFSSAGKCQTLVKLDGKPFSVAFTDCGDLLTLVPLSNNKLSLFNEEGQFIKYITDKHLKKPQYLYIKSDGRLIVTEGRNNEVKVLSPDGNDLLLAFVAPNCGEYPNCAIYHQNKFYVSYPGAHCIKVFDQIGMYLNDIGCQGSNDGQFDYPHGLVIDKYNRLVVCNVNKRKLQLFSLSGKFLRKLQGEYFENIKPFHAVINENDVLFVADSWGCISVFR